jgi:hypothetical protein
MNRREFLIRSGTAAAGGLVIGALGTGIGARGAIPDAPGGAPGRGVSIVCDPRDPVASAPPARWAAEQLRLALTQRGIAVRLCDRLDEAGPADLCVVAVGAVSAAARDAAIGAPTEAEALALAPGQLGGRDVLLAAGGDVRGLVYALTELADAVALGEDPQSVLRPARAVIERPANAVRSVMRMVNSEVDDKPWFNDRDFWRRYLSLLVTQRFNRFNLALGLGYDRPNNLHDTYFYFAYPFFIAVPGYNVRATNLADAERDRNLEMLRFISDEAAARGLQFQLGVWTHAYRWINSPNANHVIEGLTPETQAPYCRDALAILLKECPNITGVTFRIHGESGVAEGSYDLWRTIFDGCVRSGRRVEIDMHAKGMDQPTMDAALATGLPVTISPKYWAEHLGLPYHQAAIRAAELPKRERGSGPYAQSDGARSFLRYGYGDLLTEDRRYGIVHRVWPGTQKVLLWGDPIFAAAYGRAMSFCGSRGCEFFDPLSFKGREGSSVAGNGDRAGYADATLRPAGGDIEKFAYTYRLWGRMLYQPDGAPDTWQRALRHDYGAAARPAGLALSHASRVLPLLTTAHTPAASNYSYWPEMGVNMSLFDNPQPQPYGETKSPSRFGHVSPLDPQLFLGPDEFAERLLKGETSGKYSPVEVAQWLEDLAQVAEENLAAADKVTADRQAPAFRRFGVDVSAQLGLGRFYARKLRAAVLFALHERTGDRTALDEAIKAYRSAREAWASVAEVTTGVYVKDLTFGELWFQRGHWADRLPGIDRDIALLEKRKTDPTSATAAPASTTTERPVSALIHEVLGEPQRPASGVIHTPPPSFRRGVPVLLMLALAPGASVPAAIQLHYRHTHQAEAWRTAPMARDAAADGYRGEIPGDYADAPYPLTYYFEVAQASGAASLHPGLGANHCDQPYFVLRSDQKSV